LRFNSLHNALNKSKSIKFSSPDPEQVLRSATQSLAPTVRNYLVSNYGANGLNTKTGVLKATVAASKVWYEKGRIRYSFPTTSAKVATYGGAQQYGWVTGAKGVLGQKAKKSLKKFGLKSGKAIFNNVKIVPPKPYYYVTDFQMDSLMLQLKARVQDTLVRSQKSKVG
jgi:hypothetical protein